LVFEAAGSARIADFRFEKDSFCIQSGNAMVLKANNFTENGSFSANPNGLSINASTGQVNLANSIPGNYQVTYTLPATNCQPPLQHVEPITLVPTPPIPSAVVSSNTNCGPKQINITASGAGTFYWYSDNSLNNLLAIGNSFDTSINATTLLFLQAENQGCKSEIKALSIQYLPLPPIPYLGKDITICQGNPLVLLPGNYSSYRWQDGNTNSTYTVNVAGIYSVSVTDANGCEAADTILITTLDNCSDLYFPNSFTPNGDNLNESFGPIGQLFLAKNYLLQIYNRYGETVYESYSPNQRWDGGDKRKGAGPSAYVWQCTYSFNGSKRFKKGSVLVIR